jgi:DNA recombination protein RmuC
MFPVVVSLVIGVVVGGAGAAALVYLIVAKPLRVDVASAQADATQARDQMLRTSREASEAIATARAAQATAEANLSSLKSARAEADSAFAESSRRIIQDAQTALVAAAAEKLQTTTSASEAAIASRFAEVGNALSTQINGLGSALAALEHARVQDREALAGHFGVLREQTGSLAVAVEQTRAATDRVSSLLSTSQARGSWGEYELRRLIEMTGMTEHVSFEVQRAGYGDEGRGRPDVVLFIAGGGTLPIDAKAPFSAYQTATLTQDEAQRAEHLADAVTAVRNHVRALAARRYHATPGCIGWTVMFVPIESMLSAVLSADPTLIDVAMEGNVLIASPLTLMIYLHAFAAGWGYAKQQQNAQTIIEHAKVLVSRLAPFVTHLARIGERITGAADAYNAAIGSFEKNLAPQARRIHEMGGAEAIPELPGLAIELRQPDIRRLPAATLFDEEAGAAK